MIKLKQIRKKLNKETMIIMIGAGLMLLIISVPSEKLTGDIFSEKGQESASDICVSSDSRIMTDNTSQNELQLLPAISKDETENSKYQEQLENKLEEMISYMEGVKSCKVMVMVNSGNELIVEKDVTFESSRKQEGSSQKANEGISGESAEQKETVYLTDSEGNMVPYVRKVNYPKVDGVVVVVDCSDLGGLNISITECIQALFGIETHKIKIVKMKS